jgi:hypothetical protein
MKIIEAQVGQKSKEYCWFFACCSLTRFKILFRNSFSCRIISLMSYLVLFNSDSSYCTLNARLLCGCDLMSFGGWDSGCCITFTLMGVLSTYVRGMLLVLPSVCYCRKECCCMKTMENCLADKGQHLVWSCGLYLVKVWRSWRCGALAWIAGWWADEGACYTQRQFL